MNTPTALEFERDTVEMTFTTDSKPIPKLYVKNFLGDIIEPSPELEFESKPHGHLIVDGESISALKNGTVTLTARVKGSKVSDDIRLKIIIVKRLELKLADGSTNWEYGVTDEFGVTVKALSAGENVKIDGAELSSHDANILKMTAPGQFKALAPGTTKIKATLGRLETSADVKIVARVDKIDLECPEASIRKTKNPKDDLMTCVVAKGKAIHLKAAASYKEVSLENPELQWSVDSESIASVSKLGWVLGLGMGTTTLEVKSEDAVARMKISVEAEKLNIGQNESAFECTEHFRVKVSRKPYKRKYEHKKYRERKRSRRPRARRRTSRRALKVKRGFGNQQKPKTPSALGAGVVDGWCESDHGVRCIDRWISNAGAYEADELKDFAWRCCCVLDFVGDGYDIAQPAPKKPKRRKYRYQYNQRRKR